jgi:hypothetical protein
MAMLTITIALLRLQYKQSNLDCLDVLMRRESKCDVARTLNPFLLLKSSGQMPWPAVDNDRLEVSLFVFYVGFSTYLT